MAEYKGLVYTIGMPTRFAGRIRKGRKIEATSTITNWVSTWVYEKSTQMLIESKLVALDPHIREALAKNLGVLVVCQYRHHGHKTRLHDVFIGAKAQTKTLAIMQYHHKSEMPIIRPAPPTGWHIGKEGYLWFDPKDRPYPLLNADEYENERQEKLKQGSKWESAK